MANYSQIDLLARRRWLISSQSENYIVFADPVVAQICAVNWGDGVGITPSQARRVTSVGTVFRDNTQIVSFDELGEYFTRLTTIPGNSSSPYGAFAGCTALESITFPSSLTSIGHSAFRGCENLEGNIILPSVSVADDAFMGCTKIHDMTVASTTVGCIWGAGDGTGTAIIIGNAQPRSYSTTNKPHFKHIVISGDTIRTGNGMCIAYGPADLYSLRVLGNMYIGGYRSLGSFSTNRLEFFELMGLRTGGNLFYQANGPKSGGIIHFGYNGIACPTSNISDSSYSATILNRLSKIYVGDGSSQEADQAVLDLYLADPGWATYSDKLDLWYNYDGEYKTPPTIPTNQ